MNKTLFSIFNSDDQTIKNCTVSSCVINESFVVPYDPKKDKTDHARCPEPYAVWYCNKNAVINRF